MFSNAKSLDECILDVEVTPEGEGRYRLSFLAIIGGEGPTMTMPRSLLEDVRDKINEALAKEDALAQSAPNI